MYTYVRNTIVGGDGQRYGVKRSLWEYKFKLNIKTSNKTNVYTIY